MHSDLAFEVSVVLVVAPLRAAAGARGRRRSGRQRDGVRGGARGARVARRPESWGVRRRPSPSGSSFRRSRGPRGPGGPPSTGRAPGQLGVPKSLR